MIAVLSPAKTLDYETPHLAVEASRPRFADEAATLARAAARLTQAKLRSLMHISPALAKLNADRFRGFADAPERPALFAFAGDVYTGLDAHGLDGPQVAFAQDHVRILSGLYGLLRPLDAMRPYRLEMGTRWAPRRTTLTEWWGDRIADRLAADLAEEGSGVVLNLASQEYWAAVEGRLPAHARVVSVDFRDGGKFVSFHAKKARGMMARWLVEHRIASPRSTRCRTSTRRAIASSPTPAPPIAGGSRDERRRGVAGRRNAEVSWQRRGPRRRRQGRGAPNTPPLAWGITGEDMTMTPILLATMLALQPTGAPPNAAARDLLTCGAAEAVLSANGGDHMTTVGHVTYFALAATEADPGEATFFARTQQLTDQMVAQTPPAERAAAVAAGCRTKHPKAVAPRIDGALPTDPFARDALCFAHASLLLGAAQDLRDKQGDGTSYDRLKPLHDRLVVRMTDTALAAHGLKDGTAFEAYLGRLMIRSLALGNPQAIVEACAALPA